MLARCWHQDHRRCADRAAGGGRVAADQRGRRGAGGCRDRAGGTRPVWRCRHPPCTATAAGCRFRRHPEDPTELVCFSCAGPPGTPLAVLTQVEGARWGVEEAIQTAKGDAGLDHYEVRRYDAWYRHVTLSLLAAAFLTVQRAATGQERGRAGDHPGCARRTHRAGAAPPAGPTGLAATDRPDHGVGVVGLAPPTPGPRPPCTPAASPATGSPHLTNEVRL
jgi:hypothetical protein